MSTDKQRAAFTLVEILIVVGLLLFLAAISLPALSTAFGSNKLRDAGQAVVETIGDARYHAIESGLIYQFRFEPDGQHFAVVPADHAFASSDEQTAENSAVEVIWKQSGRIRDPLLFQGYHGASIATDRLPVEAFAGLPDMLQLEEVRWSPPVLFHPDGTATDSVFEITDERERTVRVSVRGLTGAVSMSDPARMVRN